MGDAPPLSPFRTFQVPILAIAQLTGLDLTQLAAVDRMPIAAALSSARVTSAWRKLSSPESLELDFDLKNQRRYRYQHTESAGAVLHTLPPADLSFWSVAGPRGGSRNGGPDR